VREGETKQKQEERKRVEEIFLSFFSLFSLFLAISSLSFSLAFDNFKILNVCCLQTLFLSP